MKNKKLQNIIESVVTTESQKPKIIEEGRLASIGLKIKHKRTGKMVKGGPDNSEVEVVVADYYFEGTKILTMRIGHGIHTRNILDVDGVAEFFSQVNLLD